MLQTGMKAPDFTLNDQHGNAVSLSDFAGKKVVLYFYSKDNTPGCTRQACAFAAAYQGFQEIDAVVIGISTSGNARNVALAVQCGKALGLKTLGLTGGKGGLLREHCDCAIVVPGNCPADVQELHLPVYHTLCAMIEAKFFDA